LTAASFIGLGIAVSAVVAGTIAYRSTHVVDYGMVNSRVIRIRSPIDGTLNTFYAQPGAKVEAGQVLATVGISLAEKKVLQQAAELAQIKKNGLEEQMQAKKNELSVARQLLLDLKSQLNSLNSRVNQVWTVDGDMLSKDLKQRQMELEVSRLKAEAAQVEYERFNTLAQEGAITQQVGRC
jgi:multidrug resistance efflux pump